MKELESAIQLMATAGAALQEVVNRHNLDMTEEQAIEAYAAACVARERIQLQLELAHLPEACAIIDRRH